MRHLTLLTLVSLAFLFHACQSDKHRSDAATETEEVAPVDAGVMKSGGLTLTKLSGSPEFPGAAIHTLQPAMGESVKAGKVQFKYEVSNYHLDSITSDAAGKGIANSAMGQHIHAILNNQPYMAHYDPGFEADLQPGHYILLSFLSRSYHESLKSPGAYDLLQFDVGAKTEGADADLSAPHLFYSRPKGTYTGPAETDKLLLDFYLVNCALSADGYTVRATINGNSFTLTEWAPYLIEGLPLGEVSVKLELLDADGALVSSPFNPVERTVTLAPPPPSAPAN